MMAADSPQRQEGNGGAAAHVPTLALRGGLSGEFVDFHLLPTLLADFDGSPRSAAIGRWAELLEARGFNARHIDLGWAAASGSGGLIAEGGMTDAGNAMAALAEHDLTRLGREH